MNTGNNQLAQLKNCDPKAQQELYDHFKAKVMGICDRYTKNREEAKDVFQEAFIKIFNHINELHDIQCLEAWIRKITVNAAINYFNKKKKHSHVEEKNGYHHQNNEYELILSHFSDEVIIDAINRLPDGYRMVFNLYVVEGYSHAEIAGLLQITEATSRSQLTKAKATLKCKLKELGIIKFEKYA